MVLSMRFFVVDGYLSPKYLALVDHGFQVDFSRHTSPIEARI